MPFNSLQRQHAALANELADTVARVIGASEFILGPEVSLFEQDFAEYCGVEHCVGVGSGTAALTIALIAAGIVPGDEVIVPGHTFISSALSVVHAGATPVFCDVDTPRGVIDPEAAAAAVTTRTSAILAVHLYGRMCEMTRLQALADRHGLALIEDAAQAHGAQFMGRRAGGFGLAAAFSFYPSKNLGALGDAGAISTNDPGLASRARRLRDVGRSETGAHEAAGFNERLDTLQAAVLRIKLRHLDEWNERRRMLAAAYQQRLPKSVVTANESSGCLDAVHLFPLRIAKRDVTRALLGDRGIETKVHYSPMLADQPALRSYQRSEASLDEARAWASEELSLPLFPELSLEELDWVAHAVTHASSRDD